MRQPERVGICSVLNLSQLRTRHVTPPSVALTVIAVPHHPLNYMPYIFRHFDLLVLKIIISDACHENKLKIKNSIMIVTVKAWS